MTWFRTTALLGCVTLAFLHLVCTWDVFAHFSGQREWEYRFLINILYSCPLNTCRKQSIFLVFPALSDSMTAWTFLEKTLCISRENNLGQCWNHSILIQSVRSHTVSWARINASAITGLLSFGKQYKVNKESISGQPVTGTRCVCFISAHIFTARTTP